MISSDFSDLKNDLRLQKSIKCVGDSTKFIHLGTCQLEKLFIRHLLDFIKRLLIKVVWLKSDF